MKKITFIILFYALVSPLVQAQNLDIRNFKINEGVGNSYSSGTQFDYQFEIKGNYGYSRIDLIVYYESVSSSNEIGRVYWNREGDDYLNFSSYTIKSTWVTSLINYNTNPGKKFILVAKYAGTTNQYTYFIPEADNDGDGIPNSQDNCPNEPGPSSTNGCPENPNLSIDMEASRVFSNCQNCHPALDLFFQNNQRHIIQDGSGSVTFNNLEIRNIGNIVSNASKVNFYISINDELDQNDELLSAKDIPFRSVNQSYGVDLEITGWDIENVEFTTGNQYILIQIDPNNTNNEGSTGENDNLLALPIRYQKSSGNIIYPSGKTFDLKKLQVFNLSGIKVLEKQVISKEEENALFNQLPRGLYIVKKGEETYKVAN